MCIYLSLLSAKVMGTGIPERQIMHASDLAKIMLWSIDHLDQELPLIVAGKEVRNCDLPSALGWQFFPSFHAIFSSVCIRRNCVSVL